VLDGVGGGGARRGRDGAVVLRGASGKPRGQRFRARSSGGVKRRGCGARGGSGGVFLGDRNDRRRREFASGAAA
jgi:hypothetical protein